MASDRSRISYDEAQKYRSVVIQQGRVLTDSDHNEAQEILAEETRREALDFVGPSGTPDNGYKISFPDGTAQSPNARSVVKTTPFDFNIGGGTMYVGGVRVSMSGPFTYGTQPEWIGPPAPLLSTFPADELVWLELVEHEVSALEDPALLEVALGGPDTAQRTRIVQRIHRSPTTGTSCADALTFQEFNEWITEGRIYDDATKRLLPRSMLKVGFSSAGPTASPCDPAASGGYSGAENQLIRVRIVSGTQVVWAYDNASSLYRVDHVDSSTPGVDQLVLTSMPVDVEHQPRPGQVVELLHPTVQLPNGGTVTEAFGPIAAISGAFDSGTSAIPIVPPAAGIPTLPLFVRIWEAPVTFTLGSPVDLPGTGLQVTIIVDAQKGARVSEGDFWTFAVRPGAPSAIYPQRYGSFQPPEGPRRWACSLGVIHWSSATQGAVVSDCREQFDNLVVLSSRKEPKSCCLTIDPSDLVDGSFQTILDANRNVGGIKFCLLPGIYNISQPIVLTPAQSGIEFEACRDGVTISGGNQPEFADGIVQIEGATGVTFRGIQFSVRVLPARGGVIPSAQPQTQPTNTTNTTLQQNANLAVARQGIQQGFIVSTAAGLGAALGIRAIDVRALTIEDCQFLFPDAADVAPLGLVGAIGAAVLLYGQTNELILRRNSFIGRTPSSSNAVRATIAGVAMIPAFFAPSTATGGPGTPIRFPPTNFDGTFFSNFSNAGFLPQAAITPTLADSAAPDAAANTQVAKTLAPTVPGAAVLPANTDPSMGVVLTPTPPLTLPVATAVEGTMLPAVLFAGDISNNHFTGCASAAFLCGDTGFIRIIGNDVTDASNGFQLIATRWVPEIAFLDATTVSLVFQGLSDNAGAVEGKGLWNAVQAVAEPVAAMMHPANVWMATALMSLSLPSTIAARPNLVVLNAPLTDHSAFLKHLVDQVQKFFGAVTSVLNPPSTVAQANLTKLVGDRIRALWGIDASPFPFLPNQVLSGIAFGALQERPSTLILALQCSENVVDVRTSGAISGTALLVLDSGLSPDGSAVVSANRFSNASLPLPTAAVALVSNCTMTGNLVQNEQPFQWQQPTRGADPLSEFWSLVLVPGPRPHDNIPVSTTATNLNLAVTPAPATALPLATNPTPTGPPAAAPAAGSSAAKTTVGTDQIGILPIENFPIISSPIVDQAWIPPLVAVTGNVFKGYAVLPPRFMPAATTTTAAGPGDPFNTWLFLNTVSW